MPILVVQMVWVYSGKIRHFYRKAIWESMQTCMGSTEKPKERIEEISESIQTCMSSTEKSKETIEETK